MASTGHMEPVEALASLGGCPSMIRGKLAVGIAHSRYQPNLAAYEAYLKTCHLAAKVTPESLKLAQRCYEQASELDPAFPLPHIGIGLNWVSVMIFGGRPTHEAVPAARAAALKALLLDPALPEAHALLGLLAALYELDWAAAERHFDHPMAKQASFTTFRPIYGWMQFQRGNTESAIDLARRAIEEDSLDVWPRMNLQAYLQYVGREADALDQLQKVLELDPNQVVALVAMSMLVTYRGDLAQGVSLARRAHTIAPWYPDAVAALAGLLHLQGEAAESQTLAKTLEASDAPVQALFHLLRGEVDVGADWVEKAIEQRDLSMMIYLRFVAWRELRASNRWPNIAKMLNLPETARTSVAL